MAITATARASQLFNPKRVAQNGWRGFDAFNQCFDLWVAQTDHNQLDKANILRDLRERLIRIRKNFNHGRSIVVECRCLDACIKATLFIRIDQFVSKQEEQLLQKQVLYDIKSQSQQLKAHLQNLAHLPVDHPIKKSVLKEACKIGSVAQINEILKIGIHVEWEMVKIVLARECEENEKIALLEFLIPLTYCGQPERVIPLLLDKNLPPAVFTKALQKVVEIGIRPRAHHFRYAASVHTFKTLVFFGAPVIECSCCNDLKILTPNTSFESAKEKANKIREQVLNTHLFLRVTTTTLERSLIAYFPSEIITLIIETFPKTLEELSNEDCVEMHKLCTKAKQEVNSIQ